MWLSVESLINYAMKHTLSDKNKYYHDYKRIVTCLHAHTHIHTHTHTHTQIKQAHTHTHTHIHTQSSKHTHTHTHTHAHTHTHTQTHKHTHTHTHTHTHKHVYSPSSLGWRPFPARDCPYLNCFHPDVDTNMRQPWRQRLVERHLPLPQRW